MHVGNERAQPRCPSCGRILECLDLDHTSIGQQDTRAFVCPAGCRGRTRDGIFEFVECPVCGSYDTCRGASSNGAEEVECNACGAVVTVQLYATSTR